MCMNTSEEFSAPHLGKCTLQMVAGNFSETCLLTYQFTQCQLTENRGLDSHRSVKLTPAPMVLHFDSDDTVTAIATERFIQK